ncbi:unnamed protein product [Penicillium pancosmium]
MHCFIFLVSLVFLGTVLTSAHSKENIASSPYIPQTVVYWGQNGGNTVENDDLSAYCSSTAGVDVIVLAFLYQYGNGATTPAGTIGQSCSISTSGISSQCEKLAASIGKCQSKGVKVILSLGGAVGPYSLSSKTEAETIGQYLWDAYGNREVKNVHRPFGGNFVNGWDFDIEISSGSQYYQHLINKLRSNFPSDPANTYYITGAPQCPIPEPNMQQMITSTQFDYLWIQFYNNPSCSVNGPINFRSWVDNVAGTPSSDAKLFIGLPASPLAATGTPNGAHEPLFGGVMMWSAGFSDSNNINGCNYVQQTRSILTTGSSC